MKIRKSDLLGNCVWFAKKKRSGNSVGGIGKPWNDRDATIEDLLSAVADQDLDPETYTYFYCLEWQKVGRKIEQVKIKEYEVVGSPWNPWQRTNTRVFVENNQSK